MFSYRFGCVVLGFTLLATACSAGEQPTEQPGDANSAGGDPVVAEGDVDHEGTLTLAFRSPPSQLDPHRSSPPDWHIVYLTYDRLFEVDEELEIQPMLATGYEVSDDGLRITLDLRDDAQFHDGTPVDANAVKVSLERGKSLEGSTVAGDLSSLEEVEVTGDYTAVLHLNEPDATILGRLGMVPGSIINPAAIEEERDLSAGDPEAGSGPYVVEEFEAGTRVLLVPPADSHWHEEAGRLAEFEILTIADNAPRLSGLRSGELDATVIVQAQSAEAQQLVDERDDLAMYTYDSPLHFLIYLRNTRSEFDQIEVRQALAHAIDTEGIAEQLLDGACTPATQPFSPGGWAYDESFDGSYDFDPDRARELLAEAGLEDGFDFELIVNAGQSPQTEIAEVVQAQLAEINVSVEITPMDSAAATQAFRAGEHDAYSHNVTGLPDPGVLIDYLLLEDGPFQMAGPESDQIEDLAAQAADSRLTLEERADAYADVSRVVMENAWYLPICFQPMEMAFASDVVGVQPLSHSWAWLPDFRYLARTNGA